MLGTYLLNIQLGQAVSLINAGFVMGLFFTIVAWLIIHSKLSDAEKRNLAFILNLVLSIAVFWLAAAFGNGSIFKLHKLEELSFVDIAFTGGIFGLAMGFGLLFDYALSTQTSLRIAMFVFSFVGFLMMGVWYLVSDGLLFVVSVIIARIGFSFVMNRAFVPEIRNQLTILGAFTLSLTFFVLPCAAFLSR